MKILSLALAACLASGGAQFGVGARDLRMPLAFLHLRHDLGRLRLVAVVLRADLAHGRADLALVHVMAIDAAPRPENILAERRTAREERRQREAQDFHSAARPDQSSQIITGEC